MSREFKEITEDIYETMGDNVSHKKPATDQEWGRACQLMDKFNAQALTEEEAEELQSFFSEHMVLVRSSGDQGVPCDPNVPITIRVTCSPERIPEDTEETPK